MKILLHSKFSAKISEATSDSCIVLGNGPSLNDSLKNHPDFLKKHPLICVNGFSLSPDYIVLKPAYYVMLDEGLWLGNHVVLKNIIDNISQQTIWPLIIYAPRSARKNKLFNQLQENNINIKVIFFNYVVFKGFNRIATFFYKKNIAMPQCQNVIVACLFLSINMGYKKIFLLGADHTWHQNIYVNEDNQLCVKQVHFYEEEKTVTLKPFYKGWHTKEIFTLHEIYANWTKVFWGYFVINKYANYRKCEILNASEISFIDAFKRIKL